MKTGIFYSFNTKRTTKIAKLIAEELGKEVEHVNVEKITEEQLLAFDNLILGSATWFEGELPNHWDEFVPAIEDLDLKGKTVAVFGLGDQKNYPDHFGDAIGTLADLFESCGAKIVGSFPTDGFEFDTSGAVRGDKFVGLMIDEDNQADQSEKRVKDWTKSLKKTFK